MDDDQLNGGEFAEIATGGPVCLDYAQRTSDDSFASENRLTSQSSNPYILFAGSFIGDYTGGVVDENGNVAHVWCDFRGNPGTTEPNQDVDVAYISAS